MKNLPEKEVIKKAFSSKALFYQDYAAVQKMVAQTLASLAFQKIKPFQDILEIGCGTGFLTHNILEKEPSLNYLATDISEEMLLKCKENISSEKYFCSFGLQDGENLQTHHTFDMILSSLTFQWFLSFSSSVEKLLTHLNPQGFLIFSTLGHQTFHEWKSLLQKRNLKAATPSYPSFHQITEMLPPQTSIQEAIYKLYYPTIEDFIKSVKYIGAHATSSQSPRLSPMQLKKILLEENTPQGFYITYHVYYVIIKKEESIL